MSNLAAPEYPACVAIAEKSSLSAILAGLEAMQDWAGLEYLSRIQAPTLILWGDSDRTYRWSQTQTLWQTIPQSNLAVVPGCAHAVHLECAHLFNQLVEDFLQSH